MPAEAHCRGAGTRRGGIRVIDHAPHEVGRHARAIVAAHAPELHALLIERLHRDVGERRERAAAGERVLDAAVDARGDRVGLVALEPRPLRHDEPVVLPRRAGEQVPVGVAGQLGGRENRRVGDRARR